MLQRISSARRVNSSITVGFISVSPITCTYDYVPGINECGVTLLGAFPGYFFLQMVTTPLMLDTTQGYFSSGIILDNTTLGHFTNSYTFMFI